MRITTRKTISMVTGEVLEHKWYIYDGPVELAGGGPTAAQTNAANSQAALTGQLASVAGKNEDYTEAQRNKTTPFYTDLMNNGPSYFNEATDAASGTNARAYAPARANLIRSLGPSSGLPGYRAQALTDMDEAQAQGYDQSLTGLLADRQAGRERGAAGIMGEAQQANPLGYFGAAQSGNQSILQAPLQKPGIAGLLGGLVGSAAKAYAA